MSFYLKIGLWFWLLTTFLVKGDTNLPSLSISITSTNYCLITISNGNTLNDYILERSYNLIDWSNATERFETDDSGVYVVSLEKINGCEFFRLRDDTLIQYGYYVPYMDSVSCGDLMGYCNYDNGYWGYSKEPNMQRHIAYDGKYNTNNIISYEGDEPNEGGCDIPYLSPNPNDLSTMFKFSILFTSEIPVEPYPIRLKGFFKL